jgi:hypothetical protein
LQKILQIETAGFIQVPQQSIFKIPNNSNTLLFGSNQTDTAPCDGLKHGPYKPPNVPNNNLRFFFIHHKNDTAHAAALLDVFTNGLPGTPIPNAFPPLAEYIEQPFYTDKNNNITFQKLDTAVQEVRQSLCQKHFHPNSTYVAIYINPASQDLKTANIYHQITEPLLERNIIPT